MAAVAGNQRTIVAHAQLIELGCTPRTISHWVNRGRLHVRFPGVYSVVSGQLPPLAQEQAALLACREHAFLSHRSAAFVWGMRKVPPVDVEVSVVGRYRRSSQGILVHRIQSIDRREVKQHEGLWVSTPARAALEVAAVAPNELVDMFDEGLARRRLNARDVAAVLARNRPCRGAGRLAAMLDGGGGTGITRSRAERAFVKLIRDSGLPRPEVNERLGPYIPDFMWRRERLIVEIDSPTYHAGPGAFETDRDKDLFYRGEGFDCLRFTRRHVVHRGAMVLVTVAGELARRAAGD